jgi:EmrB/QacA subfamily drug resistance transporter
LNRPDARDPGAYEMAISLTQPCDESFVRAKAAAVPCEKSRGRWILTATILASSMAFIDGTVVNVALPALQKNLQATVSDVQWVVEAYALTLSAFLLLGGSLGDHYGRRRAFLAGVIVFTLASVWCGLASNVTQLIAARGVQGLGGALLVPGSLAIISASFGEKDRGHAIGTWSGFTAITAAIGPLLGGWLIEHISWRAVFFINVPLALVVLLISLSSLPESRDETERAKLDWVGAALTTVGLGGIVYALIESSRLGWRHPAVFIALGGGVLVLLLFLYLEARIRNPMLPPSLFRSRDFSGANILTFLLYAALGGTLFFLPLNLIQVQGYSATAAGAALLPFILILFSLSRWGGGLVERYGAKRPLVVGPFIAAIGFALFAVPAVGSNYWLTFFPAAVVLGLGMAVSVAPLTTTVMNSVPANRVGIASGINNAVSRAAGLIAVAALGIIMVQVFNHVVDQRLDTLGLSPQTRQVINAQRRNLAAISLPPEISSATSAQIKQAIDDSFVGGFRAVMLIGAALGVASGLVSLLLIHGKTDRPAR